MHMAVSRGSGAIGTADRGPEHAAEGGLALADRASVGGGMRHHGDHAAHRDIKADGVALAGALPGGRGRWPVARQEPAAGDAAAERRHQDAGADQDDARDAAGRDPLERALDGRARSASATPASRISGARTASSRIWWTASRSPTTRRSRRKSRTWSASTSIRRTRRWSFRSTRRAKSRALDRSQPGLPMKKGRGRHHDPRLQAPRHDHPVRGAQPARWQGHRPLHEAPPPPGVHSFPPTGSTAKPCPIWTFT